MSTYTDTRDLVRTMSYKPGWQFQCMPGANGDAIVYVEFWADNSSPSEVDPRTRVVATGTIHVTTSGGDIRRQILDGIAEVESHESREFLRFEGVAPFHPHRSDGEHLYRITSALPVPTIPPTPDPRRYHGLIGLG